MADLGTVGIAVEVRGREALRQLENDMVVVDRSAKSAARSFEAFERAGLKTAETFRYVSDAAKKRLADEQRITQELVKQRTAAEQLARANAQKFQSQIGSNLGLGARGISAGASGSVYEAELERLRTKYDRVYSASKLYEQQLNEIRRAESLGAISTRRMQQELDTLNNEYQQFSNAAEGAFIANNRFSQHVNEAGRGLNNFGMYAQQVGYQVGDFFVQVQSGTNVMVAFGQQATQLAGLIPGVLGAALGIGISLFTAIASAMMRASGDSETLAQSLSNLESAVRSVADATDTYSSEGIENLIAKYGQLDQQVLSLVANQTAYANLLASKELNDALSSLQNAVGGDWWQIGISEQAGSLINLQTIFNVTANDARSLRAAFDEVAEASTYEEQAAALTTVSEYLRIVLSSQEEVTQEQLDIYSAVLQSLEAVKQLSAAQPKQGWLSAAITQAQDLATALWDAAAARVAAVPQTANMTTGNADWAKNRLGFTLPGEELLGLPAPRGGSGGGGGRARQIKEEIQLTKELTAVEKERQTILNSVQSSIENGFMAMVSGTDSVKDAFKKMAFSIIQELYKVLVVQRMVGSFDVATGGGSGIMGFLGGLFKRETGGTMMPGQPYLVGERGPELVIPRHSGTVVNANQTANAMGGSGTTVVNNNISVTGSDAAMVRTEIAKMIPQITNATKAAVIDAKQRGGQMAAAFR